MSFSSHVNNPDDIPSDELSVPDTPMSHLMFYFYCVDKLTNLSENNVQLRRVIDYKNDNLTPSELEILLVFCTQLDPDSLEGKCLIKNDELCGDKNFKVCKIEDLPEGIVKSEDFFIAGQRVKCERVIVYKKNWIKTHFYEPWMTVIVPDKQTDRKKEENKQDDIENRILLPSQSPTPIKEPNNNNGSKVVIIEGNKVRVEESNKVRINQNGSKVIVSEETNNYYPGAAVNINDNNNNNILPSSPAPTPEEPKPKEEVKEEEEKPKPVIVNISTNIDNNINDKPPQRVKSTPNPQPSQYYPPGPPAPVESENKPISKHFTAPSNNNITPSVLQQQQYQPSSQPVPHSLRQSAHTTKVDTNSNDIHIVINSKPPQNQSQHNQQPQQHKPKMLNRAKKVYKYVWCCFCEVSKCLTCCIDCIRNILTFIILLVFIAFLSMKFVNYMDYNSSLLQKYAIIAMFSCLSLSLECIEICINCCTVKSLNYMGYRLYSIFIAIYYILICIYTGITDSSLPFYCFIFMAIIHLFGSCWRRIEDEI